MAALLAYTRDLRGLDPDGCAEVIHKIAGLIGRGDDEVKATLRALPLRAVVSKDDMQLAYRLVRTGVPGSQLATAVRRAKLGLGETPLFCERLTLCDRGVVMGSKNCRQRRNCPARSATKIIISWNRRRRTPMVAKTSGWTRRTIWREFQRSSIGN